jgi:SAM-dependent methyltransferase
MSLKEEVQRRYGSAARQVTDASSRATCGCGCGSSAVRFAEDDPVSAHLYAPDESAQIPTEAVLASLGCGNPTALARLQPGETVLDLGSGGGIDVLLSARRVGPDGKAYGLDMTDEMLALANENKRKSGLTNVEFLRGEIEHIPLPDQSVDVIISNCVINLSADKDQVLREAFRVLKPGGRLAISDIVTRGEIPAEIRKSVELWVGCIAGALDETEYVEKLRAAGFEEVSIEPTRVYRAEDARTFLEAQGIDAVADAEAVDEKFYSGFVRATRPADAGAPVAEPTAPRTSAVPLPSGSGQPQAAGSQPRVEVFDPAMCCSTGVCGPSVDPLLAAFAADVQWLGEQGVAVARHNLAQEPRAFVEHAIVKELLATEGDACLPLVIVDGEVVAKGAYPRRDELARRTGLTASASRTKPVIKLSPKGCCG